jgi:hypothetical protein
VEEEGKGEGEGEGEGEEEGRGEGRGEGRVGELLLAVRVEVNWAEWMGGWGSVAVQARVHVSLAKKRVSGAERVRDELTNAKRLGADWAENRENRENREKPCARGRTSETLDSTRLDCQPDHGQIPLAQRQRRDTWHWSRCFSASLPDGAAILG